MTVPLSSNSKVKEDAMNSYEKLAREAVDHALNSGRFDDPGDRRLEQLEKELAGDFEEAVVAAVARVNAEAGDAEAFALQVREERRWAA